MTAPNQGSGPATPPQPPLGEAEVRRIVREDFVRPLTLLNAEAKRHIREGNQDENRPLSEMIRGGLAVAAAIKSAALPSASTGGDGGVALRPMETAPKGVPIIARHKPNAAMPHGWIGTIKLHDGEEDPRFGRPDTILHHNGETLIGRFYGCWEGWLPLDGDGGGGGVPDHQEAIGRLRSLMCRHSGTYESAAFDYYRPEQVERFVRELLTAAPPPAAETEFYVRHPLHSGRLYPARVVLADLAAQEGCDGEPYDTMQAVAEAMSAPPAAETDGKTERVRHLRRGTEYEVLHRGVELQVADTWAWHDRSLPEGCNIVIYRGDDGKLWAREEGEFEDGLFVPAPSPKGR